MSEPRFFAIHPDYSQLLSGAHRKPAARIGAPALICHLAFWQSDDPAAGTKTTRDQWKQQTDQYIHKIYLRIKDLEFTSPNVETSNFADANYIFLFSQAIHLTGENKLIGPESFKNDDSTKRHIDRFFSSDYQVVVFNFKWNNLVTTLRFEKHFEYLTLTCFIDLSDNTRPSKPTATDAGVDKKLEDALGKLDALLASRVPASEEAKSAPTFPDLSASVSAFQELHQTLYDWVWLKFFSHILLAPFDKAETPPPPGKEFKIESVGTVFADFRGLVLNHVYPDATLGSGKFFQLPFWRPPRLKNNLSKKDAFTSQKAKSIAETFWPFLSSHPGVPLDKYEFTVSRMLGNRAVYVTALGAQPSPYLGTASERQTDQMPVFYLAYLNTFSRWQTGRLLDKIDNLGTARIASIQEVVGLRTKSSRLRTIADQIDHDLMGPPDIAKEADGADETQGAERPAVSEKRYGRGGSSRVSLEKMVADIKEAQATVAGWNAEFSGGLPYRIERSRYYVKEFRDGLVPLRIRRVEGYQPYDVFVENRLGATWDFIDRLGTRLERLDRRIGTAYQYVLAHSAVNLQRATMRQGDTLLDLQAGAELFFLAIAAPYYFISTVDHVLHSFPMPEWASVALDFGRPVVWAAFVIAGLLFFRKRRREIKRTRKTADAGEQSVVSTQKQSVGQRRAEQTPSASETDAKPAEKPIAQADALQLASGEPTDRPGETNGVSGGTSA